MKNVPKWLLYLGLMIITFVGGAIFTVPLVMNNINKTETETETETKKDTITSISPASPSPLILKDDNIELAKPPSILKDTKLPDGWPPPVVLYDSKSGQYYFYGLGIDDTKKLLSQISTSTDSVSTLSWIVDWIKFIGDCVSALIPVIAGFISIFVLVNSKKNKV